MTILPERQTKIGWWRRVWSAEWQSFQARRSQGPRPFPRPSKLQIAIWLIATVFSAGLILSSFDWFQLGAYDDDAQYVVLARSLVEAGQFGGIYSSGRPAAPIFPFGFPLLLAPLVWAFPGNYEVLKIIPLVATLVNIALIFWGWPWLSRNTSRWWGVAIMICFSLSPLVVSQASILMSEPVFTTGCLVACILIERIGRGRTSVWWQILLGIALLAMCAIRSVGLVFAIALFLDLFLALGRMALKPVFIALAAACAVMALLVVLTPVRGSDIFPPVQRYTSDFVRLTLNSSPSAIESSPVTSYPIRVMTRTYRHFVRDLRAAVFAIGGGAREKMFFDSLGLPFLPDIIGFMIGTVIILGLLRAFRAEGGSAFLMIVFVYLGALIVWSWNTNRFLYPILPQLLFGLFAGIAGLLQWLARLAPNLNLKRVETAVLIGVVLLVTASFVYRNLGIQPSTAHTGDLSARMDWIRANTEPDAVIMSNEPAVDFIYGARHTVDMFYASSVASDSTADRLMAYLASNEIDYVLIAPDLKWQETYFPVYSRNTTDILGQLEILEARDLLSLVYTSVDNSVKVYQLEP